MLFSRYHVLLKVAIVVSGHRRRVIAATAILIMMVI